MPTSLVEDDLRLETQAGPVQHWPLEIDPIHSHLGGHLPSCETSQEQARDGPVTAVDSRRPAPVISARVMPLALRALGKPS